MSSFIYVHFSRLYLDCHDTVQKLKRKESHNLYFSIYSMVWWVKDGKVAEEPDTVISFPMGIEWKRVMKCITWPMLWEGCLTYGMLLGNLSLKDESIRAFSNPNLHSNLLLFIFGIIVLFLFYFYGMFLSTKYDTIGLSYLKRIFTFYTFIYFFYS